MDSSTSLKPNDIALILRPTIVDGKYTNNFQVLVSGFGPLTISEDDVNNLIGMATILAATVQYMEKIKSDLQQSVKLSLLYSEIISICQNEIKDMDIENYTHNNSYEWL